MIEICSIEVGTKFGVMEDRREPAVVRPHVIQEQVRGLVHERAGARVQSAAQRTERDPGPGTHTVRGPGPSTRLERGPGPCACARVFRRS